MKRERKGDLSVGEALQWGDRILRRGGVENSRLEARVILAHILGWEMIQLLSKWQDFISPETARKYQESLKKRVGGWPLQYLTGEQEFWSLCFKVTPEVLIPRKETEILIEQTLKLAPQVDRDNLKILDLGVGCGAIAIALASELAGARIYGCDINPQAVALARDNAKFHHLKDKVILWAGDLFSPLAPLRVGFDFIVSNPPYISQSEWEALPIEIKGYEPRGALEGGSDGLKFYREIIPQALQYLAEGGFLLMELGVGQAEKVKGIVKVYPAFTVPIYIKDPGGIERVIQLQKWRK